MVRQRGYTVMEAVVAMAILVLIATSVVAGDRAQFEGVAASLTQLRDSRLAATQIERLRAGADSLEPGETRFAGGVRRVRIIRPNLLEVVVEAGQTRLVTWIARGVR